MFKEWLEMNRSPVKAHFLLLRYPSNYWGVYLLDSLGKQKHLWNKNTSEENVRRELIGWAHQQGYDGAEFKIEDR